MFSEIRSHVALQCILTFGLSFGQSGSNMKDVMTLLFTTQQYEKKIRPIKEQTMVLNISVAFVLNSIIDFDEGNEALKTSGFLFMNWTDEYLQWNSTEFNGTDFLILPQDDIWKPDISLKNSIASSKPLGPSYLSVYVNSTGEVQWYPYQVLRSSCDVDIRYIPFDVQTCNLVFTAWSYTKDLIRLTRLEESIYLREYTPNSMWDIQSTAARDVTTHHSEVLFEIKLKRKPGFYIINIIVPIILLSFLNTSFVLPITSGERASFSITVFLSLAVFLTIVAASLPKNSDNVSLLSVYLILMTVLSTLIVVMCLVEARLATRNTTEHPIGNGFLTVYKLTNILRCKTCRRRRVQYEITEEENKNTVINEVSVARSFRDVNWIDIVDSIDVLLFILFMSLTILSTVVIFTMTASH